MSRPRTSASTAMSMSGYCSLQASARPSWPTARCTWPSEAAAAAASSKSRKRLSPVRAELARHAPAHEVRPHRRRLRLQADQLGDVLGRQGAWHGREQLRHLDHRPAQAAERRGELARQRRGLAGAEVALARKSRHEAAEHRRDPGVAGEATGQAAPAGHRRHQRLIQTDRPTRNDRDRDRSPARRAPRGSLSRQPPRAIPARQRASRPIGCWRRGSPSRSRPRRRGSAPRTDRR